MRREFAQYVRKLIEDDKNIYIFLGDISVGLFLDDDVELYPNVLNLGILEQSMISYVAGLSRSGIIPFVHTISPFIVERAYEQIKLELSYNKCKCILVSANGPFDYNKLGPTHHCSSDVPLMDLLGNINIFLPGRIDDVSACIDQAIKSETSSYIRLTSRSVSNAELIPGTIMKTQAPAECLQVFLGEALNKYYEHDDLFEKDDVLYIYSYGQLPEALDIYSEVNFWEPYSKPIVAQRYRCEADSKQSITSNVYPRSIEDGIYHSFPQFKKITV